MADNTTAKAGDKLNAKAIQRKLSHYPQELLLSMLSDGVVKAKTNDKPYGGQWICIDCGEVPQNNFNAHTHAEKHTAKKPHRLAWRNFVSGNIEEP